jgi:hypothetical protein
MYLAPLTLLICAVVAFGWWLQQRDTTRDVVDRSHSDALMSTVIKRGLEEDNRRLQEDIRRLREDNARLKRDHETDHEALWTLLEKAEARHLPYAKLDFLALSEDPTISPEDFQALRAAATKANADYEFLAKALNFRVRPPMMIAIPTRMEPTQRRSWKASVALEAAQRGVPVGRNEIDTVIDDLTQAGRFTPGQGAALKAHNGPLNGDAGARTVRDIVAAVLGDLKEPVAV